jgi:hypothetical protein
MLNSLERNAITALAFLLLLTLVLTTGVASATPRPNLFVENVGESSGFITVTFSADNLFSPRVVETLERGLPATLSYELQLWKARRMWFDRLLWAQRVWFRIGYDPWEGGFAIETREGMSPPVLDLEQIENSLCSHVRVRLGSLELMEPSSIHYIVVRATLEVFTAEDVDEVETWLGEGQEDDRKGITAIPGYLFDTIVGLSGFGDESASGRSLFFRKTDFTGD